MALTDAQKRAQAKYKKNKVKQISLCFYPAEKDLYEYVNTKSNKAGFIKSLIAEALKKDN